MLKIIAISIPVMNARFIFSSSLQGAGDARFVALTTFFGVLLARPLISLLLVNVFKIGLAGVWIALVSDFALCFVITLFRFRRGKWMKIVI